MKIEFTKATLSNIAEMRAVTLPEITGGILLDRTEDEIAANIRSYTLALHEGAIVGFTALHIHTTELAEIRSLVVKDGMRGQKIGERLVENTFTEAKELGIKRVLSLTYKQSFFERLGFIEIPKESIPEHKIWADCIKCQHFPVCNEVSLIKTIQ